MAQMTPHVSEVLLAGCTPIAFCAMCGFAPRRSHKPRRPDQSPAGTGHLSPAPRRWVRSTNGVQVPEGRPRLAQRFSAG